MRRLTDEPRSPQTKNGCGASSRLLRAGRASTSAVGSHIPPAASFGRERFPSSFRHRVRGRRHGFKLRRRSTSVVPGLCLDLASSRPSNCRQIVENKPQTEPMLRSVSKGQTSLRCRDLGGHLARSEWCIWYSNHFSLQR